MEDMYGRLNPKPLPPAYDSDDIRHEPVFEYAAFTQSARIRLPGSTVQTVSPKRVPPFRDRRRMRAADQLLIEAKRTNSKQGETPC